MYKIVHKADDEFDIKKTTIVEEDVYDASYLVQETRRFFAFGFLLGVVCALALSTVVGIALNCPAG